MSSADDDQTKKYRCLCSLMHVRTGSIVAGLLEFLLIAHSLIFVCSTLASGQRRYERMDSDFSRVIEFKFMMPSLIIQSLWILTIVFMLLGIKAIRPWLTLPHLILEICAVIYGVTLTVLFLINIRTRIASLSWTLGLVVAIFLTVTLIEVYFVIVSFYCYRYLVHQRLAVNAQKRITQFYTQNVNDVKKNKRQRTSLERDESSSPEQPEQVTLPPIIDPIQPLPGPLRIPPTRLEPLREIESEESTEYDGASRLSSATYAHGQLARTTEAFIEPQTINGLSHSNNAVSPQPVHMQVPNITIESATDVESLSGRLHTAESHDLSQRGDTAMSARRPGTSMDNVTSSPAAPPGVSATAPASTYEQRTEKVPEAPPAVKHEITMLPEFLPTVDN